MVLCGVLLFLAALTACGKKGPPLAPLRLVPAQPAGVAAHVFGDTVYLKMIVPTKNANGPGAPMLDHLEVLAATVDAGAPVPPNPKFLTSSHVIARIAIKPPPDPDAPPPDEPDTRPAPGDPIAFAEKLTPELKTPEFTVPAAPPEGANAPGAATPTTTPPPAAPVPAAPVPTPPTGAPAPASTLPTAGAAPGAAGAAQAATTPEATTAPKPPAFVTRIYAIRGVTKGGRPGTPSTRLTVPLVPPPPPPDGAAVSYTEKAVTVTWRAPQAPLSTGGAASPTAPELAYNVYAAGAAPTIEKTGVSAVPVPLNDAPVKGLTFEHGGAEPGKEQCFVVRSVEVVGGVPIESDPSPRACVTPIDQFPPAAPASLAAVATAGAINLIWDANTEADLAGYLVLRGEAPGDTLQPLTPEPIRETRFRDTTVQPGVRYVYAIVAVDRAGNRSAPSRRVEEMGR